jgi:hypothetical protein
MEILNQDMEIRSDDPGRNNGKVPGFRPIESNPFCFQKFIFSEQKPSSRHLFFPFSAILAHESRSVAVRLNTCVLSEESTGSRQK